MKKLLIQLFLLCSVWTLMGQNRHYVAFCALDEGVGHAFVVLGREDPQQRMTVHDGAWGLYPQNRIAGGKSLVIGEVPGIIRDDFLTRNDHTFVLEVTPAEYQEALRLVKVWRNKRYELLEQDCLTFLIEMAQLFKGKLVIPDRAGLDNLPAQYLQTLIERN